MTANVRVFDREALPLRILVVDDNKDAADSMCLLLRMWGFDVRVAYDGQEALTAAPGNRPEVLLRSPRHPRLEPPAGYTAARSSTFKNRSLNPAVK
jgi:CheY-like chemotaxis protein